MNWVSSRRSGRGARGVTLLEVLVAAMLMAMGLVGAMEVIARCARTIGEVEDRSRALLVARSKMDEVLKEPVLQLGADQSTPGETPGDYDWQAVVEESPIPSMVYITVIARNRVSEVEVILSTLRRTDLQSPDPEDGSGSFSAGGGFF
jgi:type II secretion system protein I